MATHGRRSTPTIERSWRTAAERRAAELELAELDVAHRLDSVYGGLGQGGSEVGVFVPLTREEAMQWLDAMVETPGGGYYLQADDGQPNPGTVYCSNHAVRMAELLTRRRGIRTCVAEAWAGDDRPRYCGICTCSQLIDTGGLTDHGVDDVLGEADDHLSEPAELLMAAESMDASDPRWPLWLRRVALHRQGVAVTWWERREGQREAVASPP